MIHIFNRLFKRAVLVYSKVESKAQRLPFHPLPPHIRSFPHQQHHSFTKGEPTLTHHHHPKSIVYRRVGFTLGFVYSVGLDKCIVTCIHHDNIILPQKKSVLCLFILSPTPNPWQPLMFFNVSIVLPFLECHILGIIKYVAFSDWLLSLSDMHQGSSMSFHGLVAHFFLALNGIPFSGCTTVYLFMY